MIKSRCSPEELHTFFEYNPKTGKVYWKIFRGGMLPGQEAGYLKNQKRPGDQPSWKMRLHQKDYKRSHIVFAMMTGRWPNDGMEIDHKNRNSLDDRWKNLREITSSQQKYNTIRPIRKFKNLPRGIRMNGKGYRASWSKNSYSPTFATLKEAIEYRKTKLDQLNATEFLPESELLTKEEL